MLVGKIGWRDEPQLEFNLHPIAMSLGLVFLNGEAITVYRGARLVPKKFTKLIHGSFQAITVILSFCGLLFAFDSHNFKNPPIPNLYTLHSWIGLSTVIVFALQWIAGFVFYFLQFASLDLKRRLMPIHRMFGIIIFTLVFASTMLGYSEKAAFMSAVAPAYSAHLTIANCFGLSLAIYGCTVLLVVINPSWRREPLPEESHIPLSQMDSSHDD
uniref:Cytochrome b561 domain-containing protein n=1 Tax=Panagrolaimus sp. JU765 TaxID=591449 RepID=A0AC34QQ11_9BILA